MPTLLKPDVSTAVRHLKAVASEMATVVIEREESIRIVAIAAICKKPVLILGAPGLGKTMLALRFAQHVVSGLAFTIQLTKFSSDTEVFGPWNVEELKKGNQIRNTKGRFPEAHVAVIDEVGKSNSAIRNTFLLGMNERVFYNPDAQPLPIFSFIGASNELPNGPEDAAFIDRFFFKVVVQALSSAGYRKALDLPRRLPAPVNTISVQEMELLYNTLDEVIVPDRIKDAMGLLRDQLASEGFTNSDRKLLSKDVLQATALYDGRMEVNEDDFDILAHALWSTPDQVKKIKSAVAIFGSPLKAKASEYMDSANAIFEQATLKLKTPDKDAAENHVMKANRELKKIIKEIEALAKANPGGDLARLDEAKANITTMFNDLLDLTFKD